MRVCCDEEEAIFPLLLPKLLLHITGKTLCQIFERGGEKTVAYKTVPLVIAMPGNNHGEHKCVHEHFPKTKTSHKYLST